jgi:hypothetical protein
MVNTLMRLLRRWPALEAFLARLQERFAALRANDFDRFGRAPAQAQTSLAPATFEMHFMELHSKGRFGEMWEMIAEDAQRAWGGREMFIRDVPRLADDTELLDIDVINVQVLDTWTDRHHERTYTDVAQMDLRYHVRKEWKEWTLDRQVHLISATGGWRTLFYPAQMKSGAGSR